MRPASPDDRPAQLIAGGRPCGIVQTALRIYDEGQTAVRLINNSKKPKAQNGMSSNTFDRIDPVAAAALQAARGEVLLRIETALRSEPQRTDWQLSRELEVKRAAIARIRAVLERQGQIPVRPSHLRVIR